MSAPHEAQPTSTARRRFVQYLGVTGASAVVAGCDSAADALAALLRPQPDADFRPPDSEQVELVAHVLDRVTYGARPGDWAAVGAMGVDAFIERQLDHERIDDRPCDRKVASIESLTEPTGELYEHDAGELLVDVTRYKLLRGVYSRRQLYEVMVDFWTDHLNIASEKDQCRWLKAADDRDVVRRHALGSFRGLIRASATSPAMLIYLDGHDNKVERPGERPNENYARELLELHTLGVDGGYTQADVIAVARCLSGWTYEHRPFRFRAATVAFDAGRHDDGEKLVLGQAIPAGGGAGDLERVLDIVCDHPSTARFIATKLCRRFIADEPPASAVTAVASAFSTSKGDIITTLRSLFASDEFRTTRANLFKRPLRYVVSALRATGARTNCGPSVLRYLERMGHAPFQYPTPDGYPIEPLPWMGTLLWRWNFAFDLQENRLKGTAFEAAELTWRLGDLERLAGHLLGRTPRPLELELLQATRSPIALMLAGPAFQMH